MQIKSRIVIDTNIWISYLFVGRIHDLLSPILASSKYKIIISAELQTEILTTAKRPKFNKIITSEILEILKAYIETKAEIITVKDKVVCCRDKKDDFILALCKDGKANYLITSDKDLLVLSNFELTKIRKLDQFVKEI